MRRRALLILLIACAVSLAAAAQPKDATAPQADQGLQRAISQAQQQQWACRDEIRQVTEAAKMVRISPAVTQANAVTKIQPETAGIVVTGKDSVYVQVIIGPDGGVSCARSLDISGSATSSELRSKAVDAAKRWKFRPYLLNRRPVFVDGVVSFHFDIS